MNEFNWNEDKLLETDDKIFFMIFDEQTGERKGLLEIDKKTGDKILNETWCEITIEKYNDKENKTDFSLTNHTA